MTNPFRDYGVSDAEFDEAMRSDEVLRGKIELAEKAAEYWRSVSPVDTGEYRDHVKVVVDGDDVQIINDDDKAAYIEYGTGGSSPTPEFAPRAKVQARFRGKN